MRLLRRFFQSARAAEEPRPRDPISSRFAEGAPVDACSDAASTGGTRIVRVLPHRLCCGDRLADTDGQIVDAPMPVALSGRHYYTTIVRDSRGRQEMKIFDAGRYVDVERVVA